MVRLIETRFGKRWVFAPVVAVIIMRLIEVIKKYKISIDYDSPIGWGWGGNGDIRVFIHNNFKFFNLTEEEIEGFATTKIYYEIKSQ